MDCPDCGARIKVVDSREVDREYRALLNALIYRRRECTSCPHKFTTYEIDKGVLDKFIDGKLVFARGLIDRIFDEYRGRPY